MTTPDEIEIVRTRLREYRQLLQITYSLLNDLPVREPHRDKINRLMAKMDEYGIGDTAAQPIFDRRDIDESF